MFNNAGGPAPTGSIAAVPVEGFDAAMALLVRSVMLGMKHAAPIMIKQRSGSIINNGSIAAHLAGYSTSMIYGAAKAAVNHSDPLRRHGARRAQRARQFRVAGRDRHRHTRQGARHGDGQGRAGRPTRSREIYAKAQPIPRAGIPDDIAQCVLWLASDRSTFVNATDIVVDGGVIGGRNYTPAPGGTEAGAGRARDLGLMPTSRRRRCLPPIAPGRRQGARAADPPRAPAVQG